MIELAIIHENQPIGQCLAEDLGLYWKLSCRCQCLSDRVERLYWGQQRLGVLEREGEFLTLHKRISKASLPDFPSESGVLTLRPIWQGSLFGCPLPPGILENGKVWYPAAPQWEFPCMPLFCFFSREIRDGTYYWTLSLTNS